MGAQWGLGLLHGLLGGSTPSAGSGLLGLLMGSDRKWVSLSSTPRQDGQGTRWGHDGASL